VTVRCAARPRRGEKRPDLVVCVVDATNLRRNLRLVLAVKRLGLPCVVALNMADLAEKRGIVAIDAEALGRELGLPVVRTVAVRPGAAPMRCASCWTSRRPGTTSGCPATYATRRRGGSARRPRRRAGHPATAWGWTPGARTWPATASTAWCCTRWWVRCCWR
jgi:hypothetical protein